MKNYILDELKKLIEFPNINMKFISILLFLVFYSFMNVYAKPPYDGTIWFFPDVIISHHGWGESMFVKDVWPKVKLAIYCEFYYNPSTTDVGFDPEFPAKNIGENCRLRLKNLNNLVHFQINLVFQYLTGLVY